MKDTLFLTAWTNARTKNIVDEIDAERMMDARSFREAKGVLQDSDYAPYLISDPDASIEEIFRKDREWLRKTLRIMGLDEEVEKFLFLDEEIFLLRVILQKEIFGTEFPEEVGKNIDEKEINRIKNIFLEDIKRIVGKKPKTPSELADRITDLYWEEKLRQAKDFGEEELENFLREYEEFWRRNRLSDFPESEEEDSLQPKDDKFARELNKSESEFVKWASRVSEGVAPLFAFVLKKRKAENLTRMILGAKEMEMPLPEIHRMASGVRVML